MQTEDAYCQAAVVHGQITKVLLTWQRSPNHPQENALLNVLNDNYATGKTYRVTIEEVLSGTPDSLAR